MGLAITQIDSFTERPFAGNPAAVCLLEQPREESWMQLVAREMNLSETAFLVPERRRLGREGNRLFAWSQICLRCLPIVGRGHHRGATDRIPGIVIPRLTEHADWN